MSKKQNALVLVGNQVKFRLQENRDHTGALVSVDALRFTLQVQPDFSHIYPPDVEHYKKRIRDIAEFDSEYGDFRHTEHHSVQALEIANEVAELLGEGFYVDLFPRKGQDFYKYRWSIMREQKECGWVGFLSTGKHGNKTKEKQDNTIHVNLHGHACIFGAQGWHHRIRALIEHRDATITRCDLALDVFDAAPDFLPTVRQEYQCGLMNVAGKLPSCDMAGKWLDGQLGHSRSFYFGSREAGKQTNVYEKGHQLFGHESGSTWVRIELRYGNKLRVIPSDVLTSTESYFAGASDWHATKLLAYKESQKVHRPTVPETIKTTPRLAAETVKAEAYRNLKWLRDVAAPSIAIAFRHLDGDAFLQFVTNQKKPGRLTKFTDAEISAVYREAFNFGASTAHA